MAALEQELMRKFKNLNENQKREVLEFVQKLEMTPEERSRILKETLEVARQLRAEDRATFGPNYFNVQADLDELREEESEWPPK